MKANIGSDEILSGLEVRAVREYMRREKRTFRWVVLHALWQFARSLEGSTK
jgi:hypothetical protein